MSIYNFATSPLAGASAQGGVTEQSLKFNDDESQYLSWTPASAGDRKTWTWSGWVKPSAFGKAQPIFSAYTGVNDYTILGFDLSGFIGGGDSLKLWSSVGASSRCQFTTNAVFRDPSAWYHIVVETDTTQATSTDRVKIYVNGNQITSFSTATYPAQNVDAGMVSATTLHQLGALASGTYGKFDGYLSDIHFIDGQALTPTSFGETVNGYWKKKDYTGSYGTNGFKLNFRDDTVSEGFNATTYLATEANQSISGIGFSPDLVIVKNRDSSANARWGVIDSVRGVNKTLATDITDAEVTSRSDLLTSFDADGFSLGADAAAYGWNNTTFTAGDRQVAWCWDAGNGSPVSNTDGTITSTVKANPAYGFSIVTHTSNSGSYGTVGHGLSSTPELMINKDRDAAADWIVYTTAIDGSLDVLRLNLTNSAVNSGATAPTSTVFESFIQNGNNVVTYCFHSVAGYSKIGSYTGTGAAGNSINLGFKPAFLLIKETGNANSWELFDNTRNTSSPFDKRLFPNDTAAEATTTSLSYSDTGFETLNGNTGINRSGGTYLYYAVADTREAAFWKDVSGENSNNWTPNNLDYRDSVFDSPANNFAVMNALEPSSGVSATLSEGNLKTVGTTVTYSGGIASTFEQSSGKWYWEVYVNSEVTAGSNFYNFVGAATGDNNLIHNSNNSQIPSVVAGINGWSWEGDGTINLNGTGTTAVSSVTAPNAGDVLGFAIDLDNGNVYFYHNGTAQNSGSAVITGVTGLTHNPMVGVYNGSTVTFNFGQDSTFAGAKAAGAYTDSNNTGSFAYEPPSDYLALCTANLPTPAITDGSAAFNTVLYTGDGTSNKSVTGTGHAPDFLWFKKRSGAESHHLGDTIRGASKRLVSNTTAAETTESGLVSFDSDGFTISGASGGSTNDSGATYAAWSWKAGGTAVSNTDGSITSQVSANVDAGFSIVSYTGTRTSDAGETGTPTTIGHGLGKKPTVVITKARTSTTNMRWNVWHQGYQPDQTYLNYQLWLNTTDQSNNAGWQRTDTGFSTTTFCPARYSWDDVLGVDYISYVFADVEGYQKAGSYTGNGSADGPFVYTGFRPAWLMVKRADTAADWIIWDDKRNTYNELTKFLYPNLSVAEATGSGVADLLSNGFKLRNAGTANRNASGGTYIYLAFAEVPFKVANAR